MTPPVATENEANVVSRSYAIVPAAGVSRRMGRPKLLLPWGDWTLIDQLLQAWSASDVDRIVVVVREDDQPLREVCRRWPVHIVKALVTPRDMTQSISLGLQFVEQHWRPADDDSCFVAPADLPGLTAETIDRLLQVEADAATVVVPHFGNRQGHPVRLPWAVTRKVHDLPSDAGVNQLVDNSPQHIVTFPADDYFRDVDTPQEYEQLRDDTSQESGG